MKSESALIFFSSPGSDLSDLLDVLVEYKENFPSAIERIDAVPSETSFLAAGIPEITEVIIALGSSGAIAALQAVLKSYFAKRPKTELILAKKDGEKSARIVVRNSDAETLKSLFENLSSL